MDDKLSENGEANHPPLTNNREKMWRAFENPHTSTAGNKNINFLLFLNHNIFLSNIF